LSLGFQAGKAARRYRIPDSPRQFCRNRHADKVVQQARAEFRSSSQHLLSTHSEAPDKAHFLAQLQEFLRWSSRPELSPLRYPGGKRRLIRAFLPIIANLGRPAELFVEPFAGGAAMSLAMLESGLARKVALSDRDELIGSFWKTVFSPDAAGLADRILDANVTLGNWKKLRNSVPSTHLERAFTCFFLNRTSFSGILCRSAGPIGGKSESSDYSIDCRFNRYALADRIIELSRYRSRVLFARTATYRETISAIQRSNYARMPSRVLWYFDPPFFEKAADLYRYCFDDGDHLRMQEDLSKLRGYKWILSYDDVDRSRQLYSDAPGFYVTTPTYLTAERGRRRKAKELIVTNVPRFTVLTDLGLKTPRQDATSTFELKLMPAVAKMAQPPAAPKSIVQRLRTKTKGKKP
jgi:DNA adenine methylase